MIKSLHKLKVGLVRAFRWSLADIAATSIDSLFGFMAAYGEEGMVSSGNGNLMAYADEVDWL